MDNEIDILKSTRIDRMTNVLKQIKDLSKCYYEGSPAWILIQNAWGHINSVHHLETKTNFDPSTLGVKGSISLDE